ncbi:hypothetical protein [Peptoniphilus duerdenii]|uniref:hypothetical protein n=1 Tax=Peptoniphilus duerdenii TaxID=507750 RepID=UPI00288A2AB2|nr:hypothetical protein [Peptoniphilus duerdenii]
MKNNVKIARSINDIVDYSLEEHGKSLDFEGNLRQAKLDSLVVKDNLKLRSFEENYNYRNNWMYLLYFLRNVPNEKVERLLGDNSTCDNSEYKSFFIFEKFGNLLDTLIIRKANNAKIVFLIRKALEAGVDYWVIKMILTDYPDTDLGVVREALQGAINGLNYNSIKDIIEKSSQKKAFERRKHLEKNTESFNKGNNDFILSLTRSTRKPVFNKEIYLSEYDMHDISELFGGSFSIDDFDVDVEDLNEYLQHELFDFGNDSLISYGIHKLIENNKLLNSIEVKSVTDTHFTTRYNNYAIESYLDDIDISTIKAIRDHDISDELFYHVLRLSEKYPDKYQKLYHKSLTADENKELNNNFEQNDVFEMIKNIDDLEEKIEKSYSYADYVGKYFNGKNKTSPSIVSDDDILKLLEELKNINNLDEYNPDIAFNEFYDKFKDIFNVNQLSAFFLACEVQEDWVVNAKEDKDYLEAWRLLFNPSLCAEHLIFLIGIINKINYDQEKIFIPILKYLSKSQWSRLDLEEIFYYITNFKDYLNLASNPIYVNLYPKLSSKLDIDEINLLFNPFYNEFKKDNKFMPLAENRFGAPTNSSVKIFNPNVDEITSTDMQKTKFSSVIKDEEDVYKKSQLKQINASENKIENKNLNTIKNLYENGVSRDVLIASGFSEQEVNAVISFNNDILLNLIKNGVDDEILKQSGFKEEEIGLAKIILSK